ncbi:hypothetical protein PMAN_a2955 [Pseudoalteromonas marina]|nr:hypothetical protein PMAN_a2955 [Pseudoalteromonas marina]GAA74801.1 hypothetical protein P20480_1265 [Pseudoalteromonas sp. BSi20480]
MAVFTPFNIVANNIFPLKRALGANEDRITNFASAFFI